MKSLFKLQDKVNVREWGEGVIIGSVPWYEGGSTTPGMEKIPQGKVWLIKINATGKIVSVFEKELTKLE